MPVQVDLVRSDERLPERVPVVVIGGGIVGISVAYFLSLRGIPTVVCEKGEVAAEQSSRNWGWIRKQGGDPSEIPLAIESWKIWESLNQATGRETGYRQCGSLSLGESDKDAAVFRGWLDSAQPFLSQLGTRVIDEREIESLLPGASSHYKCGLYTATDGRAEPQMATAALAEEARARGARIFTHCAVRSLETAAGRISGVVTEKGRIACDSVVLAGGAWCRLFCENAGIHLPQLKLRTSVMSTGPVAGAPSTATLASTFAFRKRLDGGYTLGTGFMNYVDLVPDSFRLFSAFLPTLRHEWSTFRLHFGERFLEELRIPRRWSGDEVTPFERTRVLNPAPVEGDLSDVVVALCEKFPVFKGLEVRTTWAGMIDVSPDAMPVLSSVPTLSGFFVATGFSGHGFGSGPGAGRLMADLVTGDEPVVDPTPFRFSRFTDGPRPQYRPRV
jgi:glycine/D-amino acid oxidase-like deaminating enzyme